MKWMILIVVLTAFSGCLGSETNADTGMAHFDGVDASQAFADGEELANFHYMTDWAESGGQEADNCNSMLAVDRGTQVTLLDVSKKEEIVPISTFTNSGGVEDIKFSDDCQLLIVASDAELSTDLTGGVAVFTGGYYVYDVSEPAEPNLLAYTPVGPRRGPHMVSYFQLEDGTELLFGAAADVTIHTLDRASGTATEIGRLTPNFLTGINRGPEVFDVYYQGLAHDMFPMQMDDGKALLYIANWDAGLVIADITVPSAATIVGQWNSFPESHEGNLHTVSTDIIDGRVITIGTVEVGFAVVGGVHYALGTDRSILYVWDTTDLGAITLLGTWENARGEYAGRDMIPGEEISSTHNIQYENGYVFMAHYAFGAFLLRVNDDATFASPETLAFIDQPGMNVWDVVVENGVLYTSGQMGVKALHYPPFAIGANGIDSRA